MKRTLAAKFKNGSFKPLDAEDLSIPEDAIVTITVYDQPPWDDPRWMKKLLDDQEAEQYLSSVHREAAQ